MAGSTNKESMKITKELIDAINCLYEAGATCKRCGWKDNDVLWATDTHAIKVKHLTALKELYIRI